MIRKLFLCVAFFSFLSLGSAVSAATIYSVQHQTNMAAERTSWLNALGITAPDTTIDFETGFSQDQSIMDTALSGGLTISSSDGGYGFVTNDAADLGTSTPVGTYALAVHERNDYTFTFDAATGITYFAFYMMDQGRTNLDINYLNGTTERVTIPAGGTSGEKGWFFALIFDLPVSSLYIPNVNGGDGEVGIDNIEFGYVAPVPVPSSFILLGLGLMYSAILGRRRRK